MPCTCLPDIRTEARFDTTRLDPEPEPEPFIFDADAARAEMFRQNAARATPWPVCRACESVTHEDDMDWFFKHRCVSCAMELVDELLFKAAKRHGRRKALKLLKALSK